ncbi:MAG: type II toxin-antitoxin system VapC family toxin [Terriglobales bacterium]
MSRIFWDANIFIYMFEAEGDTGERARALRLAMIRRGDQLLTSALALAEILVKPMQKGALEACECYERAIGAAATVLKFDAGHARTFARIRSQASVRSADAVHLSCAAVAGVDLFVTGDAHLQGLHVPGIQFIAPLTRVPL